MTKPEVVGMYRGMFESIDGLHIELHDVAEIGDQLWARCTVSGTHSGELFGVAGTGRPISQGVMTVLRFVDAHCVERWSVADTLAVLTQIGAITMPG